MRNNNVTKRSALLVASIGSFLTPFMASSLNIALPRIGDEFGMDAILLSWVATSYLLSAAVFLVPFGRFADIHGRKRIFSIGILVYTAASFFCAVSGFPGFLIAARVVQGIGGAMIFGTSIAIITSVFPPGERGKAIGINVAAVYLGQSVGPVVGGFMTYHFGWRSIFFMNVPLGILMFVLITMFLKAEWAEAKGAKFDVVGSAIYAATLVAIMYGLSILPALSGGILIAVGLLCLAGFAVWESRSKSPVLDVSLFRGNRTFTLSSAAALINYGATAAVGFLLSIYLQDVRGLDPDYAGIVMISQPLIQAIFSPFAGRLSDRIEPRIVASAGMGLCAAGLVLFAFVSAGTSIYLIVAGLVLLGFGFALFSSPNTNAIMSSVEKRHYGVASGMVGTMRLVGMMLSMGIAMLLISVFVGHVKVAQAPDQFISAMRTGFAVFAALCFAGIFASLARGRLRKKHKNGNKI